MKSELPQLKRHFSYRKFQTPPYRFLFLKYDYFVQNQLLAELRRQGHLTMELSLPKDIPTQQALRTILENAATFRPDILLVLNNMGLDPQGHIIKVLSELSLPVAIWYLDNHRFLGPYFEGPAPDLAITFSSDRVQVSELKAAGFTHAFYLPLATDLSYSTVRYDDRYRFLREKVAYVGGTFANMIHHFHTAEFEACYKAWNPDFQSKQEESGHIHLETAFAPYRDRFEAPEDYHNFIAYVVFCETRRYRVSCLRTLLEEPLVVFGLDDWKNYLPEEVVQAPVIYALETPNVYRNSAINLSLATFQQETALNQRLFDVPMCSGFILTDWRDALADHFELDEEVAYFRNSDELQEKVRYYRQHPESRSRIVEKARERILREHLMEHRVTTMLDVISKVCA